MTTPSLTIAVPQGRPATRQAGLTLIELMISMAIGLVLLAAITSLIVAQSSNRKELEKSSRQIENGRYASQMLRNDIQLAGFYGQLHFPPTLSTVYTPDPCTTAPAMSAPDTESLKNDMSLAIQGYDSPASSPIATCLPDADFVHGTDILVVRHADTQVPSTATNDLFIQSAAGSAVLAVGNSNSVGTASSTYPLFLDDLKTIPAPVRLYHVYIYFLSPCNVPAGGAADCTGPQDDSGHPVPTLKRLTLSASGGTAQWTMEPLVEGIENMQFDYGIDNTSDGYPDNYVTNPGTLTNWSHVMAVRINLLARNVECTTGYRDTKTYNLGLTTNVLPPPSNCTNGDYKRHVFTELVRAINPSGRSAAQ